MGQQLVGVQFPLSPGGVGIADEEAGAGDADRQGEGVADDDLGGIHVAAMGTGTRRGDRLQCGGGADGAEEGRPGCLPADAPGEATGRRAPVDPDPFRQLGGKGGGLMGAGQAAAVRQEAAQSRAGRMAFMQAWRRFFTSLNLNIVTSLAP